MNRKEMKGRGSPTGCASICSPPFPSLLVGYSEEPSPEGLDPPSRSAFTSCPQWWHLHTQ